MPPPFWPSAASWPHGQLASCAHSSQPPLPTQQANLPSFTRIRLALFMASRAAFSSARSDKSDVGCAGFAWWLESSRVTALGFTPGNAPLPAFQPLRQSPQTPLPAARLAAQL